MVGRAASDGAQPPRARLVVPEADRKGEVGGSDDGHRRLPPEQLNCRREPENGDLVQGRAAGRIGAHRQAAPLLPAAGEALPCGDGADRAAPAPQPGTPSGLLRRRGRAASRVQAHAQWRPLLGPRVA